jgi:hypothetical protein
LTFVQPQKKLRRCYGEKKFVSEAENTIERTTPHFKIDINIDDAKLKADTTAATITPIFGRIHSVQPNAPSPEGTIILLNTSVFIIGFFVGKDKPDIHTFLQDLIGELCRLSPLIRNSFCSN